MRRKLTKKELQNLGILDVLPDGTIIKYDNTVYPLYNVIAKHKYGLDKKYPFISVWDKRTKKQSVLLVHNVVWIWYNGQVPDKMDISHKDDNPFNNSIDNLEIISRKENLAKRKICGNQHYNTKIIMKLYNELLEYGRKIELFSPYCEKLPVDLYEFAKIYDEYPNKDNFILDIKEEMNNFIKNFNEKRRQM